MGDLVFSNFSLAIIGGFMPTLLWLHFWLREDKLHPEPRRFIVAVFAYGAIAVIPALFIEKFIGMFFTSQIILIALWAMVEEVIKFTAVWSAYKSGAPIDEPIDWIIYMVTAALGFAALENAFFLLQPISSEMFIQSLVVGNLRFLGATLLHVLTASLYGAALSFAYYKRRSEKKKYLTWGLIASIVLHIIFNVYIVTIGSNSNVAILILFSLIWIGLAGIIILFERIKKIRPPGKKFS